MGGRGQHLPLLVLLLLALLALVSGAQGAKQCGALDAEPKYNYTDVFSPERDQGIAFSNLPGFTRSFYDHDHALITHESRVWLPGLRWTNSETCHLITPVRNAHFTMYLARMREGSSAAPKAPITERFFFVTDGEIIITPAPEDDEEDQEEADVEQGGGGKKSAAKAKTAKTAPKPITVGADGWAYFPPGWEGDITSSKGAMLIAFERIFAKADANPVFLSGRTDDSPLLPTAPEVFRLRKLLPQTGDYDFNVHVMDFSPGEFLEVKEVHYNQHGMIILQGQGIYRLGDRWIPVQAGDVIWMAPFVPQWYAALGKQNTRYLLYKDVGVDPLVSP